MASHPRGKRELLLAVSRMRLIEFWSHTHILQGNILGLSSFEKVPGNTTGHTCSQLSVAVVFTSHSLSYPIAHPLIFPGIHFLLACPGRSAWDTLLVWIMPPSVTLLTVMYVITWTHKHVSPFISHLENCFSCAVVGTCAIARSGLYKYSHHEPSCLFGSWVLIALGNYPGEMAQSCRKPTWCF